MEENVGQTAGYNVWNRNSSPLQLVLAQSSQNKVVTKANGILYDYTHLELLTKTNEIIRCFLISRVQSFDCPL